MKEFVLRYKQSSVGYMKFRPAKDGKTVFIHGARGCSEYYNNDLPVEEARSLWRELVDAGYHQVDPKTAPRDWWFRN